MESKLITYRCPHCNVNLANYLYFDGRQEFKDVCNICINVYWVLVVDRKVIKVGKTKYDIR